MTDSPALRRARKERDVYKLMLDRLARVTAEERKYLQRSKRFPWFVAYRRRDGRGRAPHSNMDDRAAEWLEVVFEIAARAESTIRINDATESKRRKRKSVA